MKYLLITLALILSACGETTPGILMPTPLAIIDIQTPQYGCNYSMVLFIDGEQVHTFSNFTSDRYEYETEIGAINIRLEKFVCSVESIEEMTIDLTEAGFHANFN